jgi:hypothetical protein
MEMDGRRSSSKMERPAFLRSRSAHATRVNVEILGGSADGATVVVEPSERVKEGVTLYGR